jgi:hypothetical protein
MDIQMKDRKEELKTGQKRWKGEKKKKDQGRGKYKPIMTCLY